MKTMILTMLAVAAIGGTVLAQTASKETSTASTKKETGFFCDRTAIAPERRQLHTDLSHKLTDLRVGLREVPDGYEFEFPSDAATYKALTEWIPDERMCCPFFDIDLRMEREGGKTWLRFTGREGVKQFIRAEFSPWFKR